MLGIEPARVGNGGEDGSALVGGDVPRRDPSVQILSDPLFVRSHFGKLTRV